MPSASHQEGFRITTANSAEKALALLAVSTPDLVLTDLRMDGMDGMALFETIARRYPGLPAIIMTARGTIPEAVSANVTQAARLAQRNRGEFYSLLHRHQLDPALFMNGVE